MMIATSATDGIDPTLLVPVVCVFVGLVLGTLLGLAIRRREVERLGRRIAWLESCLQDLGIVASSDSDGRRVCVTVEAPD